MRFPTDCRTVWSVGKPVLQSCRFVRTFENGGASGVQRASPSWPSGCCWHGCWALRVLIRRRPEDAELDSHSECPPLLSRPSASMPPASEVVPNEKSGPCTRSSHFPRAGPGLRQTSRQTVFFIKKTNVEHSSRRRGPGWPGRAGSRLSSRGGPASPARPSGQAPLVSGARAAACRCTCWLPSARRTVGRPPATRGCAERAALPTLQALCAPDEAGAAARPDLPCRRGAHRAPRTAAWARAASFM